MFWPHGAKKMHTVAMTYSYYNVFFIVCLHISSWLIKASARRNHLIYHTFKICLHSLQRHYLSIFPNVSGNVECMLHPFYILLLKLMKATVLTESSGSGLSVLSRHSALQDSLQIWVRLYNVRLVLKYFVNFFLIWITIMFTSSISCCTSLIWSFVN